MERAVLEAIILIAAVCSIVWTVVQLLDRAVQKRRIRRIIK